jgi:hypothetical protein
VKDVEKGIVENILLSFGQKPKERKLHGQELASKKRDACSSSLVKRGSGAGRPHESGQSRVLMLLFKLGAKVNRQKIEMCPFCVLRN